MHAHGAKPQLRTVRKEPYTARRSIKIKMIKITAINPNPPEG